MLDHLNRFVEWVESGACLIRDRITNELVPLVFNAAQRRMLLLMMEMAERRVPIRIIILKARKLGFSTLIQALGYFLARTCNQWTSMTLAHTDPETNQIFNIAKRVYLNDRAVPGKKKNPAQRQLKFIQNDGLYIVRTGGGQYVASGDTVNFLHISELPKWAGSEWAVGDQMMSIMGALPKGTPNSICVIESTANQNDVSGEFERRWRYAETGSSGFEPLFVSWLEESTYAMDIPLDPPELSELEQELRKLGATDQQLAWRRWMIATEFNGDATKFSQEYPHNEESAFQTGRGKIFPMITRAKHDTHIALEALVGGGYQLYRAIDFGGVDPFTCIFAAHKPGSSAFTVDREKCPQTWRELTTYSYDARKKPQDRNNHAIDPVRCLCMTLGLQGHLHIYREIYEADTAHRGLSIPQLAQMILSQSGNEPIIATVADRSRPDSILLLNQQGVVALPSRVPETVRYGEIEDGLDRLRGMMLATIPLLHPPRPEPIFDRLRRRRDELPFAFGVSPEARTELEASEIGGGHPLFGVCY